MSDDNDTPKCAFADEPAGKKVIIWLTAYYLILAGVLAVAFISAWCTLQQAIPEIAGEHILNNIVATVPSKGLFATKLAVVGKTIYIVIPDSFAITAVLISGAFGGIIHGIRSFYYHVIEGDLKQSEVIKLILRPVSGAVMALIFYLVLRAGLGQTMYTTTAGVKEGLQQGGSNAAVGDYQGAGILFYTATGAIVGMFTDQTVAKLKKVAEAILTKPDEVKEPKQAKPNQAQPPQGDPKQKKPKGD